MNHRSLAALVTLNVILLAGLVVTAFAPREAAAQLGPGRTFLMVSGEIVGREQQAGVFIIDRQSTQVVALLFRSQDKRVEYVGTTNIAQDAQRSGAPQR
jgi:hypothetical protein